MGILDVHFHDSNFSLTVNPGGSNERTFSFGSGESGSSTSSGLGADESETHDDSFAGKLWMLGALAVFVGVGIGINKLRRRLTTDSERSARRSVGRRLSLSRSK